MDAAATLRRARARAGLSLRELARRAGTSHATLSAYEHGQKVPSVETFDRIVRAAGFRLGGDLVPAVEAIGGGGRDREIIEVLELAEQFPARHDTDLRFPIFGRASNATVNV